MKKLIVLLSIALVSYQGYSQCIDPSLINPEAICPMIWAPVCGCDGITYANECEATNYGGVTSWTAGECAGGGCSYIPPGVDFGPCDQWLGYAPTSEGCVGFSGCGYIGSDGVDYTAAFFGDQNECNSSCPATCVNEAQINLTTMCPMIWDPVCGCDGVTYSNSCVAWNYGGVTNWTPGECAQNTDPCFDVSGVDFGDCEMAMGYAFTGDGCEMVSGCGMIVGGIDYSPYFYTDIDSCNAACTGYVQDCIEDHIIDPEIACLTVWEPVCGCDGVTYTNDCTAFYQYGVTSWTPGECNPQSVGEFGVSMFTMYPNPADDQLIIRFDHAALFRISVFDVSGREVLTQSVSGTQAQLELGQLQSGVYLIQALDGHRLSSGMLIVEH